MGHVITINTQHLYALSENSTNRIVIKEKIIICQAKKLKE